MCECTRFAVDKLQLTWYGTHRVLSSETNTILINQYNLFKWSQLWIVITIFRLIRHQIIFRSVSNQLENCGYNPNSILFNKTPKYICRLSTRTFRPIGWQCPHISFFLYCWVYLRREGRGRRMGSVRNPFPHPLTFQIFSIHLINIFIYTDLL